MNPNQTSDNNDPLQPQPQGPSAEVKDIYSSAAAPAPPASYPPASRPPVDIPPPAPYTAKPRHSHSGLRGVISTILLLAIAPLIAFGITSYIIQSYQVDG
jgi:hypothetical protein